MAFLSPLYATAAVLAARNPLVPRGGVAAESDTGVVKIGDGVTRYVSLPTALNGTYDRKHTVNVADFGAAANGTTNDVAAFTAAIAALGARGGTIQCGAATYRVEGLALPSNIRIRGVKGGGRGGTGTIISRTTNSVIISAVGTSVLAGGPQVKDIEFEDLRFEGSDFAAPMLDIAATTGARWRRCYFFGCTGQWIRARELFDSRFLDCDFEWGGSTDGTVYGIELSSGSGYEYTNHIHFSQCRFESYRGTAIGTTGSNTNEIFIHSCKFESVQSTSTHLAFNNAVGIGLVNAQVTGGGSGTIPELVKFTSCNTVTGSLLLEIAGGATATPTQYVTITGGSKIDLAVFTYGATEPSSGYICNWDGTNSQSVSVRCFSTFNALATSGKVPDPGRTALAKRTYARQSAMHLAPAPGRRIVGPSDITTSLGAAGAATAITNALHTDGNVTTAFRMSGCTTATAYPNTPPWQGGGGSGGWGGLTASTGAAQAASTVDFMIHSSVYEIELSRNNTKSAFRVFIDGQLTVDWTTLATSATYRLTITAAAARAQHVRIQFIGISFYGVTLNTATDALWVPPFPIYNTRSLWIGDSYTASAQDSIGRNYVWDACERLGWEPIYGGISGTGYVTGGTAFPARVSTDITPQAPDIVVIVGSLNDDSRTPSAIQAAATSMYGTIATALPGTPVFVFGPQWPTAAANSSRDANETAVRTAALAAPNVIGYASLKGWITGTGNNGATNGSGNADTYTDGDGVHPSDIGHRYLGARMALAIGNVYRAAAL